MNSFFRPLWFRVFLLSSSGLRFSFESKEYSTSSSPPPPPPLSENTTSIVMSIARTFQFGLCAACEFNSKGLPFHCNRFVQNNMDQLLHLASVAMLPISWYNPDHGLMGDL